MRFSMVSFSNLYSTLKFESTIIMCYTYTWCYLNGRRSILSPLAVNVSRASALFELDLRDVFAYDLLSNQLRPLGSLLG